MLGRLGVVGSIAHAELTRGRVREAVGGEREHEHADGAWLSSVRFSHGTRRTGGSFTNLLV